MTSTGEQCLNVLYRPYSTDVIKGRAIDIENNQIIFFHKTDEGYRYYTQIYDELKDDIIYKRDDDSHDEVDSSCKDDIIQHALQPYHYLKTLSQDDHYSQILNLVPWW